MTLLITYTFADNGAGCGVGGLLASSTDASGAATTYGYDALGKVEFEQRVYESLLKKGIGVAGVIDGFISAGLTQRVSIKIDNARAEADKKNCDCSIYLLKRKD